MLRLLREPTPNPDKAVASVQCARGLLADTVFCRNDFRVCFCKDAATSSHL